MRIPHASRTHDANAALSPEALLVTLTVSQLRALIAIEVCAAMERAVAPRGDWMTKEEVAEMVGYEPSYISELVRRRGLPAHQRGGRGSRHMFKRAEVEDWIRKGER